MDAEIKKLKEEEQIEQKANWCCCLPGNVSATTACGIGLLVIGAVWLFNSLGVFTAGFSLIWPLLFICLGLVWLVQSA